MTIESVLQPNRYLIVAVVALPLVFFAGYLSFLIVPIVVREVVPEVVRLVTGR